MTAGKQQSQKGFTFVAALLLLALLMLGLSSVGPMWSHQVKREKEQELLRLGALYAQALASYHDASPGSLKQYPLRLDALLVDTRFVGVRRHLRTLYADPLNPGRPWGLLLDAEQRVVGVYSMSDEEPVAQGSLDLGGIALPAARRYSDWKFTLKAKS